MAKTASIDKRERRRSSRDSDLGTLDMPSAPQQQAPQQAQQVQSGPGGGSQVVLQTQGRSGEELSRHEIRDRIANGGMSALELQHKLRTDVFMTDLDRATYMEGMSSALAPQQQGAAPEQPQAVMQPAAPQRPQQDLSAPPTDVFTSKGAGNLGQAGGPAFHSQPIGGHDALGAEGALAPQGVLKPQGVMTSVGMIGFVKGLMGIRSDGPKPGELTPKNNSLVKSAYQPVQQLQQQKQQQQNTSARTETLRQPGSAPEQQSMQRQAAPAAERQQEAGPASVYQPVQSAYDSSQHFQPNPAGPGWFSQALWGNRHNPIAEILNRLFAMIRRMLGIESEKRLPPHLRGGSN